MGMDVIGRKPKNKTGEYFRANVWSYRPIHFLCMKASLSHKLETGEKELIQPKTLMGMSHNSGHGLRSERKWKLLAEWLEKRYNMLISINSMIDLNLYSWWLVQKEIQINIMSF